MKIYIILILMLLSFFAGEYYMQKLINQEIKTNLNNYAEYKCMEKRYNFNFTINDSHNSYSIKEVIKK